MLRVSLSQVRRTDNGDVPELLAQVRVDENGIYAEDGERVSEMLAISVMDPQTRELVGSHEDPVRWARLLPQTVRSGDLVVFVEEVDEKALRKEGAGPMADIAEELAEGPPALAH